jgi:hypothetical protein
MLYNINLADFSNVGLTDEKEIVQGDSRHNNYVFSIIYYRQ